LIPRQRDGRGCRLADESAVPTVRNPISTALCIAAVGVIAALFFFARPQYRDPYPGRTIDLSGYPAPARGWTWQDGQPGYRFGEQEQDWNIAQLKPAELARTRATATRLGMSDLRPLSVERYAKHRLGMIVAATSRSGRTCLGFALPERGTSFVCPRNAAAFVAVVPNESGAFLFGIARADVKRVTVRQPGDPPQPVYGGRGAWGTFIVTLAGERARLDIGGRHVAVALTRERLLRVAG